MISTERLRQGSRFFLVRVLRMPERWIRFLKLPLVALRYAWNKPLPVRTDLPVLLMLLGLKGQGVEIGVSSGQFSDLLLLYSGLSCLYSVDHWKKMEEVTYVDGANVSQEAQDQKFENTRRLLSRYRERSVIMRISSAEAAKEFADGSLDFVYIDANHSYEECLADLLAWWPKLKSKGVFAGHDYLNGEFPFALFGVKQAVDEFASQHRERLYVTQEKEWPTWYLIKGRGI